VYAAFANRTSAATVQTESHAANVEFAGIAGTFGAKDASLMYIHT
jgi:hypothetical protein